MRQVYLDNAATTALDPRVYEAMKPYFEEKYGNPSSFHTPGKQVKDDLDAARVRIAGLLGARSEEIIFTSGGTESDNLAILGFARANKEHGKHIITTPVEHHAVLHVMDQLMREGFEITFLEIDEFGRVSPEQVIEALRPDTILVSIMYANNEIGTIEPIGEIGNAIEKYRTSNDVSFPVFHTDAAQAAGYLELDTKKLHVDMLSLNGSKVYGPKGVGLLFRKRGLRIEPLIFGGGQEGGIRPGTENAVGIIGLAKALEIVADERVAESKRLVALRDKLADGIMKLVPKVRLNGHLQERLPNNVSVSVGDIEGEALLLYLDAKGIYCSTGSACTSASLDPSHVVIALGLPGEVAHGTMRFSLGRSTTEEDIDYVLEELPPLVERLRKISPVKVPDKYFK